MVTFGRGADGERERVRGGFLGVDVALTIDVGASGTSVFTLEKFIKYFLCDMLYFDENVLKQKNSLNISSFCWSHGISYIRDVKGQYILFWITHL